MSEIIIHIVTKFDNHSPFFSEIKVVIRTDLELSFIVLPVDVDQENLVESELYKIFKVIPELRTSKTDCVLSVKVF